MNRPVVVPEEEEEVPGGTAPFGAAAVTRGAVWRVVEIAGGEGLTFLFTLILARLLSPEEFGLVAIATTTVLVVQLGLRHGLVEAIIQRPRLARREVDTALWANLGLGLVLGGLTALLAAGLARLADKPLLAPILTTLSLLCVLQALTFLLAGLLRRRLDYRALALRALLATVLSYAVGIALALDGFGAWALVAVQLVNAVVSLATLGLAAGWRPRVRFDPAAARSLARIAVPLIGYALPSASAVALVAVLGFVLPAEAVGVYYVAERLTQSLLLLSGVSVADLSLPVLARLQADRPRHAAAAREALQLAGLVCLPAFTGLAVLAEPLVLVLLGAGWTGAVGPLRLLALCGLVAGLTAVAAQVLISIGDASGAARLNARMLLPAVLLAVLLAPLGLLPAVAARAAAQLASLHLTLGLLAARLAVPRRALLADLAPALAATATMALGLLAAAAFATGALQPAVRLAVEVPLGCLLFLVSLWLLDRKVWGRLVLLSRSAPALEA
jgi:PST family polysaccharide transporter